MTKGWWLLFHLCASIQLYSNCAVTTDTCDHPTEKGTLKCKRKSTDDFPNTSSQAGLPESDAKLTSLMNAAATSLPSGVETANGRTESDETSDLSNKTDDSGVLPIESHNISEECANDTWFYHNITIAKELLPPLLQQTRNQTFVKISESDKCLRVRQKTAYHLNNFVSIKSTFANSLTIPVFALVLVIWSDTFDEILNRETLQNTPDVTQGDLTPLEAVSICNSDGLCSGNSFSISPLCYCDHLCPVYDDCCLNADNVFRNSSDAVLHRSMEAFTTCFENDYLSPKDTSGYWVIAKCPNIYPQTLKNLYEEEQYIKIKRRCENPIDDAYFVPVVSLKTKLHYRNAYCALCHNEDSYIFWSQKRPFQFGIFGPLRSSADVIAVYPPPRYEARVCFNFSFVDCPDSLENSHYGRIYSKLCRSHQNPVANKIILNQTDYPDFTKSFSIHRNLYCFVCNTRYIQLFNKLCLTDVRSQFYDWSSLGWIFRIDMYLDIPNENGETCQPGEIWQTVLKKCVQLECPPYQTPYNGRCEEITSYLDRGAVHFQYYMNGNVTEDVYMLFIFRCSKHLQTIIQGIAGFNFLSFQEASLKRATEIKLALIFQQPITVSQFYGIQVLEQWTFMYSKDLKVDFVFIPVDAENSYSFMDPFIQYPHFTGLNQSYFDYESVLCFTDEHQRDQHGKGKSETCMHSNLVMGSDLVYSLFTMKTSNEEIVLTYACMGLSSIALAVILFRASTYRKISSVKRILLHCMTVKLLTHITFLVGCGANDYDLMCYIIGVVLHYLWLCAFAWSSVCAYFFYFVFVLALSGKGKFLLARDSSIFGYIVFGYTLPLILVSLSVGFDVVMNDNTEKSYGSGICFITGKETLLFGFAFPTCLMTFFNLVCFLSTVLHVMKSNSLTFSWREKFIRYFPVCVRMSVLLSFTWGLGFVASWLDDKVFWLVFIVVDGLQGFILSISFISCRCRCAVVRNNLTYRNEGMA